MRKAVNIIALVLVIAVLISGVVIGITKKAEYNYVLTAMTNAVAAIKDGTWTEVTPGGFGDTEPVEEESEAPDIKFVAGTYGGVEFNTFDDVVNYYNEAYNKTKTEKADYQNKDGSIESFYKLVGEEHLSLKPGSLLVDGKENSVINGLAPSILGSFGGGGVNGLAPSANRNPDLDVDENGESLITSRVTVEDVLNCAVGENEDGTIKITIVPQPVNMSHKGLDAQGHFFNSLGAIDATIEKIGVKWASGTTEENCQVVYKDGSVEVTIDPATGVITKGDYHMIVKVNIIHASLAILNDRSASLTIYYDNNFPASDEYLLKEKGLTRV